MTDEEKQALHDNVLQLLDETRRRYQFRTSPRIAVVRIDRMEEWSPWLLIPWKDSVALGRWKVFGVEKFGDAVFAFFCLPEEDTE